MKKTIYFIILTILVAGILSITALAIYQNQISAEEYYGPAFGPEGETYTNTYDPNQPLGMTGEASTGESNTGTDSSALGGETGWADIATGAISGATGAVGETLTGGGATSSGGGGSAGGSSGVFSVPAITGNPIPSGYGPTDPQKFADSVITLLTRIAGALMIIVLLYGGVLYISSAGNEESIKKAQGAIKFAIIGMIVVVMSYFILQFVVQLIT